MPVIARLRRFSVGQRMAAILVLVLLPVAVLSVASAVVLEQQETAFRDSVEESIHTLLPLSTLEHYLQRALVDELEAQSDESVPDFAALTENIDASFERVEASGHRDDLDQPDVLDARRAWLDARPSVQQLIERVHSLQPHSDAAAAARARDDLQRAIRDIGAARAQLAQAVEARYTRAIAARRRQLMELVAAWAIALVAAALLVGLFLQSVLAPIRALGRSARRLGAGETDVRAPVDGDDELTELAERFNDMAAYWDATHRDLKAEAHADPLTGLLNRRGILEALEHALAAHRRDGRPLSVFVMDLDRFKQINDHLGHSAGDRALVWVAQQLRAQLRADDRLGRYGGDEFLAILPDTDRTRAEDVAGRLEQAVREAAARESARPTLSVGLASTQESGHEAVPLIEAADAMLYANKQRGRNGPAGGTSRAGRSL